MIVEIYQHIIKRPQSPFNKLNNEAQWGQTITLKAALSQEILSEATANVMEGVLPELRLGMELDAPSTGLILIIRNMGSQPLMTMPKHWRWKKN
jgi:hypothetical protein